LFLFCTYIRPLIESNTCIWSPYYIGDIDKVENVQRKFTKYVPGLFNTPYLERLNILGLQSLEIRRIVFDLVLVFKIVNNLIDIDFNDLFYFNVNATRGHRFKLNVAFSRINCRKYFYSNRVVPVWNNLPSYVLDIETVKKFKIALDNLDFSHYCKGRAHTA
jgi:hypothetical protein